jgi:O-antigen biosynthesis protein
MKISIITPTHDTRFLKELEETIVAQNYQDWEWIVLLNNGAEYPDPRPSSSPKGGLNRIDERIKIIQCPFNSDSIGMLKKYACSLATGEIIAEVDHDDMITPDCLDELMKAFGDEEIGFVYSDSAKLPMNGPFSPYLTEYGWTYRMFNWKGKNLYVMNSQSLVPEKFGYIWFAPDHIRAWRKNVYDEIGGHDGSLMVCDDLDLMHRLFMVTKFYFIPKVLYIYRITGDNSWLNKCDLIQEETVRLYNKNIESLRKRYEELNIIKI